MPPPRTLTYLTYHFKDCSKFPKPHQQERATPLKNFWMNCSFNSTVKCSFSTGGVSSALSLLDCPTRLDDFQVHQSVLYRWPEYKLNGYRNKYRNTFQIIIARLYSMSAFSEFGLGSTHARADFDLCSVLHLR